MQLFKYEHIKDTSCWWPFCINLQLQKNPNPQHKSSVGLTEEHLFSILTFNPLSFPVCKLACL